MSDDLTHPLAMIEIELSNQQEILSLDLNRLQAAARLVLETEGVGSAELSVAVVTDDTIHQLNRRYLDHDYATDVLSFVFHEEAEHREGEVLVSAETALRVAAQASPSSPGWTAEDELLLYLLHGVLHFIGMDDQRCEQRAEMRERERFYLSQFGLVPPEAEDPGSPDDAVRSARFSHSRSADTPPPNPSCGRKESE